MTIRIADSGRFGTDLEAMLSIPIGELDKVFSQLQSADKNLIDRDIFEKNIITILGANDAAKSFVNFVLQFAEVLRQPKIETSDVHKTINLFLSSNGKDNLKQAFDDRWKIIESIMTSRATRIVEKAFHLAYEHSNILHDIEIFTDLRPVFDDSKEEINGGVIVQTLHIETTNNGNAVLQSVVIDKKDLQKLKKIILEAQRKADQLEKLFYDSCGLSVYKP